MWHENDTPTLLPDCQYLLSSQTNDTGTNLADHVAGLDHNSVFHFLKGETLTPALIWEKVQPLLVQSEKGYLIFDATVLDSVALRGIAYKAVLMDTWYATTQIITRLIKAGKFFYCPVKKNRLVDDSLADDSGG